MAINTIKSTSVEELGDPTLGLLWRAHKDDVYELVFGTGVRFGFASEDDPDNLLDVPMGDGTTDLRGRVEYYRDLGNGFDLKLQLEHDIQFSDHVTKRVPQASQFLTGFDSKEKLKRDMETLSFIVKGISAKECAEIMETSKHTVAGYLKDIYRKLHVSSRAEVTLEAIRLGIVIT